MMDFKVEWVFDGHIHTRKTDAYTLVESHAIPVVRLAEVEKLIDTAVMHAQWLVQITDGESDENQDARSFLASIAAWREWQKEGKT